MFISAAEWTLFSSVLSFDVHCSFLHKEPLSLQAKNKFVNQIVEVKPSSKMCLSSFLLTFLKVSVGRNKNT